MANKRFIKFIPSEEALYLQEHHPNAFLLLCYIAHRARRTYGSPDGLEIGEALIGDYKKMGIESEGKYRTAKKVLERMLTVKIIETCRTRKKATTGITTEGTKVKLLKSTIWDINSEVDNDRLNDRITTEQRPDNDEQECKNGKNGKKKAYLSDSIEFGLATFFFQQIQTFLPDAKQPDIQAWAKHIDFIIRLDHRTAEDVKKYIEWMTHDIEFWQGKILSPDKLRKQWDKLTISMKKPAKTSKVEENKKHAESALNLLISTTCYIEIHSNEMVFIPTAGQGTIPVSIKFTQTEFKNAVNQELQKKGFKTKVLTSKVSPMPQIRTETDLPEHNEA